MADRGTQLDSIKTQSTLGSLVAQQIAESFYQRLTFAEFMELALYHPLHGYYSANRPKIGVKGDFFTSPHLGPDFGELLAEQLAQMWQILQYPSPFTLVEMGAGQGLLAVDVLRYLQTHYPKLFNALQYIIVERAAALIAEQQWQLQEFSLSGLSIQWRTWEDIPPDSITGCFFSNELVDALPVHQVVLEQGQLKEIYVTCQMQPDGSFQFVEVMGEPSTSALPDYFSWLGIDIASSVYPNGYRSEVNLAALDWMKTVADRLHRGYVLTIDYGYPAERYYHPNRTEGTLQCYYHHAHHSNPYCYVGEQDITAHVNFTALERQGEACGLKQAGFTKQGLFLMALGLGDRIAALSQTATSNPQNILTTLQQREALHQLVNPMGLGNFGVLIQSKGVESSEPLRGLQGEV